MVTFERLTIDTDFEVWDIFHNGIKIGFLRKEFKYKKRGAETTLTKQVDRYYLEVFYRGLTLPSVPKKQIKSIVQSAIDVYDIKRLQNEWRNCDLYKTVFIDNYQFKGLKEGREGFTIQD